MKIHNYLEGILGNKTKIKAIRKLYYFPEKAWTIRELAASSKISHVALMRILPELTASNLLNISRHGNAQVIKLNTQSYIYKSVIKKLFDAEEETKNELVKDLKSFIAKEFKEEIILAAVFGSIAKKQETSDSDIDLVIIANDKAKVEHAIEKISQAISLKYGNELMPMVIATYELKKKIKFINSIKDNAIVIAGKWP